MSDWKSDYNVTDQGAFNAGVYGKPNSMYDIARAQAETQKIMMDRGSYVAPSFQPPPYQSPQPLCPPPPYHWSDSTGNDDLTVKVLKGGAIVLALCFGVFMLLGVVTSYKNLPGPSKQVLATNRLSNYEINVPADVETLSATPSTVLYDKYLAGASRHFKELNPKQQSAVAAAWLRYLRAPEKFITMPASYRHKIYNLFCTYLDWRAEYLSDKQASKDRIRIMDEIGPVGPYW